MSSSSLSPARQASGSGVADQQHASEKPKLIPDFAFALLQRPGGLVFPLSLALLLMSVSSLAAQFERRPIAVGIDRPILVNGALQQDEESAAEEDDGVVVELDRDVPALDPMMIRMTMLDGTIMTGKVDQETINVATDFGQLTIPVARIKRLRPGLRSYPELHDHLKTLIQNLGAADFEQREAAQKELLGYGLKISKVIRRAEGLDDAERKKRVDDILKALETMRQDQELLGGAEEVVPWELLDIVETDVFTVAGKIEVNTFQLDSKYGTLQIKLSDIALADRMFGTAEPVRKALVIDGAYLAGRKFKSSQIRVEKGDRITVVADGQLTMTPWGGNQQASPDGNAYYGMYNQFPGGALIASIGSGGEEFLVGKRKAFTAESSGVLQFAIAMQPDYSNGNYNFPGKYTLRIEIEPK